MISRSTLSVETGFNGGVIIPGTLHQLVVALWLTTSRKNVFAFVHTAEDNVFFYSPLCLKIMCLSCLLQLLKENIPTVSGMFCGSWSDRKAWALCIKASMLSCLELSLQTQWVHLTYSSVSETLNMFPSARGAYTKYSIVINMIHDRRKCVKKWEYLRDVDFFWQSTLWSVYLLLWIYENN